MLDLIIKNGKCYIDGELKDVDVAVKDGKIHQIGHISEEAKESLNAEGQTVLPGCIDTQLISENQVQLIQRICIQEVELQLLEELPVYLKCQILILQHQLNQNFKES